LATVGGVKVVAAIWLAVVVPEPMAVISQADTEPPGSVVPTLTETPTFPYAPVEDHDCAVVEIPLNPWADEQLLVPSTVTAHPGAHDSKEIQTNLPILKRCPLFQSAAMANAGPYDITVQLEERCASGALVDWQSAAGFHPAPQSQRTFWRVAIFVIRVPKSEFCGSLK
jgi:hypothetical protein